MFTIRDKVYKVEYEGLYLLCLGYEKFGHYIESCGEKVTRVVKREMVSKREKRIWSPMIIKMVARWSDECFG